MYEDCILLWLSNWTCVIAWIGFIYFGHKECWVRSNFHQISFYATERRRKIKKKHFQWRCATTKKRENNSELIETSFESSARPSRSIDERRNEMNWIEFLLTHSERDCSIHHAQLSEFLSWPLTIKKTLILFPIDIFLIEFPRTPARFTHLIPPLVTS